MRISIENNVKKYRKAASLTQEELARKVAVTRLTIISLEKGRYEPTVGLALRLAKVFGCKVEDLFILGERE